MTRMGRIDADKKPIFLSGAAALAGRSSAESHDLLLI
jgi:hypothetical protein